MKNLFLLLLLIFASCQKKDVENIVNTYSIEIYGDDNCAFTTLLRNECTKSNINFQYFNVSNSDNRLRYDALLKKYFLDRFTTWVVNGEQITLLTTTVNYPTVLIKYNNEISCLERPSIDAVKKLIKIN
jgi:hypothetical protein